MLYPETLILSKVCSILNEELCFKIDDLWQLKQINSIIPTKEELLNCLTQLQNEKILEVSSEQIYCKILLNENYVLYNLINVPNKINKKQLIDLLKINENNVSRLYKQSLYWILVSEDTYLNNIFEQTLKNIVFEEGKNLKYEITNSSNLRKPILKKIQNLNYMKETNELKASPENVKKEYVNQNKLSTNSNSEAFSWRKKSDISSSSGKDE
jgi:hypothetical protein